MGNDNHTVLHLVSLSKSKIREYGRWYEPQRKAIIILFIIHHVALILENLKLSDELECLLSTKLIVWTLCWWFNQIKKQLIKEVWSSVPAFSFQCQLSLTEDRGGRAAMAMGDPDKNYPSVSSTEPLICK